MQYVLAFLKPWLCDYRTWMAIASWALKMANLKLGLGLSDQVLTDLAAALSTWSVAHVGHGKFMDKLADNAAKKELPQ